MLPPERAGSADIPHLFGGLFLKLLGVVGVDLKRRFDIVVTGESLDGQDIDALLEQHGAIVMPEVVHGDLGILAEGERDQMAPAVDDRGIGERLAVVVGDQQPAGQVVNVDILAGLLRDRDLPETGVRLRRHLEDRDAVIREGDLFVDHDMVASEIGLGKRQRLAAPQAEEEEQRAEGAEGILFALGEIVPALDRRQGPSFRFSVPGGREICAGVKREQLIPAGGVKKGKQDLPHGLHGALGVGRRHAVQDSLRVDLKHVFHLRGADRRFDVDRVKIFIVVAGVFRAPAFVIAQPALKPLVHGRFVADDAEPEVFVVFLQLFVKLGLRLGAQPFPLPVPVFPELVCLDADVIEPLFVFLISGFRHKKTTSYKKV